MKKLLSLLSVLIISGTVVPTTIAASPYQKEETIKNSDINYQQTNYLENLSRNKRDVLEDIKKAWDITVKQTAYLPIAGQLIGFTDLAIKKCKLSSAAGGAAGGAIVGAITGPSGAAIGAAAGAAGSCVTDIVNSL